jgi:hypothetical protein
MKYALKIASERKTGKTDSPNALQSIIQGKDEVRYGLILCSSTLNQRKEVLYFYRIMDIFSG